MLMSSKLNVVKSLLVSVTTKTYHYYASEKNYPYIVWQEDGQSESFSGDNKTGEYTMHGTIDLYTKTEFDSTIDSLHQALMNSDKIASTLNSVQYEPGTNLIHYEWSFEV